jgi:hypothetical protein
VAGRAAVHRDGGWSDPPFLTLSLNPIFVETAHPLWGRRDVMAMFTAVAIEETAQRFTLTF